MEEADVVSVATIIQVAIAVLAFLGGVIGWLWTRSYKAKVIAERPYPCKTVLDLQEELKKQTAALQAEQDKQLLAVHEKLEKHDGYFTNDRKRLEKLELFKAGADVRLENLDRNVLEIKETVNKIFLLTIESKDK